MKMPIYLDYQATTPVSPEVFSKMEPFFMQNYGNPHSNFHKFGLDAKEATECARRQIAESINAHEEEIVFMSGATEANNLAILKLYQIIPECSAVITLKTEHKCILESCEYLKRSFPVIYLDVMKNGLLDLNLLEDYLKKGRALVSVMLVNNETGVIQNLEEISKLVHMYDSLLHTDAAQGLGKIKIDVNELGIDAMSLSAHKFYGPKGVGAFWVSKEIKNQLEPIIYGGGQEFKIRSGTLPVPLVVGMGEAAALADQELEKNNKKVAELRDLFRKKLMGEFSFINLNGSEQERVVHNLNFHVKGIEAERLIINTSGVAISTGSACTSGEIQSSHVLRAMGLSDQAARESFRVSLSHLVNRDEIEFACKQIASSIKKLL